MGQNNQSHSGLSAKHDVNALTRVLAHSALKTTLYHGGTHSPYVTCPSHTVIKGWGWDSKQGLTSGFIPVTTLLKESPTSQN